MVNIVNIVFTADVGSRMDLKLIANSHINIIYRPKQPNAVIWRHRNIKSTCLLFASGKMVCTGSKSIDEGRRDIRRYARILQKLGCNIHLKNITVRNITANHRLQGPLPLVEVVKELGASYEPELIMPAAMMKREGVHFSCFHNGRVTITGFKSQETLDEVVYPILLELECFTK